MAESKLTLSAVWDQLDKFFHRDSGSPAEKHEVKKSDCIPESITSHSNATSSKNLDSELSCQSGTSVLKSGLIKNKNKSDLPEIEVHASSTAKNPSIHSKSNLSLKYENKSLIQSVSDLEYNVQTSSQMLEGGNDTCHNKKHPRPHHRKNRNKDYSVQNRQQYDSKKSNKYQDRELNDAHYYKDSKPISFTALKELITKPVNEILISINKKHCGFMVLIKQDNIRPDMMALVLISLGKACTASLNQSVCSLLNTVCNCSNFLLLSIQKYLVSFRHNQMKEFHLESLSYLTDFLQKFQQTLPSSSSETISMLLPLLRSTSENFLRDHELYEPVMKKLNEIEEENERFKNEHTPSEIKKISYREELQTRQPPENFRSLPVLPSADDMNANAFLRPNIVEGKYVDTEQYLDIQYRLLREDYVKPLRDGIADYLLLKKSGKSISKCRDVRVYENVHIVKQDFVNGGMVHIAQFSSKNFSKIKWEYSKRFLSGSLLCLSSDNFKTMLFASVAKREPEQLKKGLLLIRFEKISDDVLNLSPLTNFVIIETSAYFEAYRHNLKALHELNEELLPLKRYFIDVEKVVDPPQYLNHGMTFDFRPLLLPIDNVYIIRNIDINGDTSVQYEFPADLSVACKTVQVLDHSKWPSASALNLDQSQYLALKAAVTREFAIIQGPPGTGKTYIGLRIVQLLLHNIDKWFTKTTNSLPILIVCYTNHALDQFLEGLIHFTDKIVRIGGRGTNEAMSKFQLSNLKKNASANKEIPKYIASSLWQKHHELRYLKQEIDRINRFIQSTITVVFGENELKNVIPDVQYNSLKSILKHPSVNLPDDGLLIHDWLGIRSRVGWNDHHINEIKPEKFQKNTKLDAPMPDVNVPDDVDNESVGEEADIEFIEAQRDIDSEEFAGVSFDFELPTTEELVLPEDSGWQVQGGRKQRTKFIKNCLLHTVPLQDTKALRIKDVWHLDVPSRWQLYKFWVQQMIKKHQEECMYKQLNLKKIFEEICELRTEGDILILQRAHIIGMTTTGAAKYRDIVLRLNPQILIVEEAAEILESHIVTSLAPKTQHVILIGDHQQLRPSPTVHMLAVKYGLNISLFERMIKNQMECFKLYIQHRMRPEIVSLIVPHIYSDLQNHESVSGYENIKGVSKNVFFVTHNYVELQENDSRSKVNEHEAKFLVKLCKYFVLQGYDPSQITVLTTYSGQLFTMKKLVTDVIKKVRFTVVDNFQGEENDIILISFVRSNEDGEIGFLKVANRVCVALSRAKKGLFCIGNFELLAEKSDLWKNIVSTLKQNQAIGPSLQLECQNHPGVCNIVANEKDFESVPEGGCARVCEYRLACGHACALMCHPYDKEHENVRCHKPCNKSCLYGHKCKKKCFEKCGSCSHLVDKTMFPCGHTIKVRCHMQNETFECTADCEKVLICGHKCQNLCSENCSLVCKKLVSVKSPVCGHKVTIECYLKNISEELIKSCINQCNKVLDCGHTCKGNCNQCHQGRLHIACNQPCKRILVCGHECKAPCAKSCPPCRLPCENRCIHSKCPKNCGEPCEVCTEPCNWHCEHQQCTQTCGKICNRVPCNEPCLKSLPCGHPCIGFCGEPCPVECRECNSDVVKEIFFGSEDETDARFVCLEDCNHILEINGLNEWIKLDNKGDHKIQMKVCPKCKTVIRTNLRYGNIIKDCLKKIENVKKITFGNASDNKEKQLKLLKFLEQNKTMLVYLKSGSLYEIWVKTVSSKKIRNIREITVMENIFHIALKLAVIVRYLSFSLPYANQDASLKEDLEFLYIFMDSSKNWMIEFVEDEYLTASEQQLQQLTWEIHRLSLGEKFLKLVAERYLKSCDSDFKTCVSTLTKHSSFGDDDVKIFSSAFKSLSEKLGSAVINLSDLEKQSVLKAMNLSSGHWYQCPNGHVYCITECGGAMEEGKCNECNEKIGGRNHSLLRTNRVATDMDGARHPAWSDAMNLRNYQF